jgi:hypothetical protein
MAIWLMLAFAVAPLAADTTPKVTCVEVHAVARYRNYGYDHLVVLRNQCDRKAFCEVSTNVNPDPVRVEMPAGGAAEVLTFRGSPAREFTPRATCHLADSVRPALP